MKVFTSTPYKSTNFCWNCSWLMLFFEVLWALRQGLVFLIPREVRFGMSRFLFVEMWYKCFCFYLFSVVSNSFFIFVILSSFWKMENVFRGCVAKFAMSGVFVFFDGLEVVLLFRLTGFEMSQKHDVRQNYGQCLDI